MRLFAGRAGRPDTPLELDRPRPDGAGWPDPADVGRRSFQGSALYELGLRNAYEIEAHAVADALVDALLPRLETGASEQDAPYFRKVVLTAARIGAGLGRCDDGGPYVERRLAQALLLARAALPGMPPVQAGVAGYFLLAGFHTARSGRDEVGRLAAELP